MKSIRRITVKSMIMLALAAGAGTGVSMLSADAASVDTASQAQLSPTEPQTEPGSRVRLDRSGHKQVGKASFYAAGYSGKTMADGTPMRLYSNNAASLTLPLGTTARVTNLETGQSAIVTIRDRGPYVKGRIVDLSPVTARKIGISRSKGLARVEVAPISVPLPDGTVRLASLAGR
jgi:rare lipoprotein A